VLVLVRHGQATANAAGLLLGRSDAPLTAEGRRQAEALGAYLRRPGHDAVAGLVSSPLRRAIDTAEALGFDRPIVVDPRWIEIDYGVHEGQALTAVPADVWQAWRADPNYRPAGGESLAGLGERVREACEELMAPGTDARSGGDVVVVSHVSPIKAAVAWALGVGDELAWRLHLSTGSITRIGWGPDGPIVHGFNWVP
jgi:broad specificity phosphatase PhoE